VAKRLGKILGTYRDKQTRSAYTRNSRTSRDGQAINDRVMGIGRKGATDFLNVMLVLTQWEVNIPEGLHVHVTKPEKGNWKRKGGREKKSYISQC